MFLHPTTLATVAGSHCELELPLLRRLSLGCFPGVLPRISWETMSGCCWRKCKNGVSGCDAPTQRPSARRRRFEWTFRRCQISTVVEVDLGSGWRVFIGGYLRFLDSESPIIYRNLSYVTYPWEPSTGTAIKSRRKWTVGQRAQDQFIS